MMFGRFRMSRSAKRRSRSTATDLPLREFAYLDEVSVQSLLASLLGALPAEITSLSAQSTEAETSGRVGVTAPLIAQAEVSSRFKGSSSSSRQVLSRAVAESLFKSLYELTADKLVWSQADRDDSREVVLERGSLIEIEVDLSPDPIYSFNATIGALTDLADDYPALLDDDTTAMILREADPVNKVLERLLAGLIPTKSPSEGLRAGEVGGKLAAGTAEYFRSLGIESGPVSVVGVTEQEKYWRDVRRVLFSQSRFTVFGRVSRSGIQRSWTPVKLTEVMRDLAPQFPDAITRVGRMGYSTPVNVPDETNRKALESALLHFALAAGGQAASARRGDIEALARSLRSQASSLKSQNEAFRRITTWLVESGVIESPPVNDRELRNEARASAGLRGSSGAVSLADFASKEPLDNPVPEMLIDLEVIAIYW